MSPWNRPGSTGSRSGTCWKTASRSSWSTRRKAKGVGSRIDSAPDAFPLPYQETHYVYGVTTAGGSGVNSNDILSATQYPDPYSDQLSSQLDTYLANALGDVVQSTDRNGTVHQSSYDTLGRLTSDAVTTLGTGVDGTVRRITYGYDSQGNPSLITSYNAASGGSIVNQVQRVYNGLGQLTGEYQSHSGAVVQGSTPEVQYAYNEMSNGENNSRLVSMTYPNGYTLNYNYSSGLNDGISRLSSLSDSSGTLESYLYLGLNTVVERDHPQTGINLSYLKQSGDTQYNGDGGDQYTGLDRFGRVIDQFWINASNGTTVDRYQYGYDPDSEVLYRQNLVDAAMSELYSYDKLGQLSSFQRGTLNASKNGISGTPSRSQSWTPDALGNFTTVTTNGTAQSRTANQQNEYTTISGSGTISYDANGNTTADGTGNTYTYDAWNRVVSVQNNGTAIASYHYDGLGRLIQVTEGGITTDLYVSSADQVLAEYQGSTVTAYNVWSPVYVNALVFRAINQGSWQRLYPVQDANWNVTALVNGTGGVVVERYAYDPYGAITVMSSGWVVQTSSNYDVPNMWQGMRYDWTTNLYVTASGRFVSPTLMRPLQTDPLGLAPDVNSYRWEGNGPTDWVDPSGLQPPFGMGGYRPPTIPQGGYGGGGGVYMGGSPTGGYNSNPFMTGGYGGYGGAAYGMSAYQGTGAPIKPYGGFNGSGTPTDYFKSMPAIAEAIFKPGLMAVDLLQAAGAGIYMGVTGEPYEPRWVSSAAQNTPPAWNREATLEYYKQMQVENLKDGAWYLATYGTVKGGGKILRKLRGRGGAVDCPINCFPIDTLVATESGLRPIVQIEAGERVWAYDFQNGAWRLCVVECRHDNSYVGPLVTLHTDVGKVTATAYHPFWVIQGDDLVNRPVPRHLAPTEDQGGSLPGRWVNSHDLREGDVIFLKGRGPVVVRWSEQRHAQVPVCNLTVQELHTFVVGEMQALVHNTSGSAAIGRVPQGAKVLQTDPNGKWVIFEDAAGVKKIQFDVTAAENVAPKPLPPRGPGKIDTPRTEATVGPDGKVYVTEGMHRLEAAQGGTVIPPDKGGVPGLPGWLEYELKK